MTTKKLLIEFVLKDENTTSEQLVNWVLHRLGDLKDACAVVEYEPITEIKVVKTIKTEEANNARPTI